VIQLDDEQCWLYAAADPDSNDLHYTNLEPTRISVIADQYFAEFREKHDVDDAIFLVEGAVHFTEPVKNTISILDTNGMESGTALNMSFVR